MEKERKDILIADLIYKHLRGALKSDEAEILEAWLLKPENHKFFLELKNGERLYDGLTALAEVDAHPAWQQMEKKMAGKRRRRWLRWCCGVAAAVAVGYVCGWMLPGGEAVPEERETLPVVLHRQDMTRWNTGDTVVYLAGTTKRLVLPEDTLPQAGQGVAVAPVKYHEVVTAKNDRLEVVLYDGTRVWLNGGSTLRYPGCFAEGKREVSLSGEAYFEVVKDAGRPFIVGMAGTELEVLGTSFNVSAQVGKGCVTTLVEGKVRITDGEAGNVVLAPGQQAEQTGGNWEVREVDTRYYTAWKEGMFAFKECPLREILEHFASHYGVRFLFAREELGELTYTTIIRQYDRVEETLRVLEGVGDFRCVQVEAGVYKIE